MAVPNQYNDPFWISLASNAESSVGIPEGLLQAVLLRGEKSNANQVSEAGAKTPFQIIPATRAAALEKYGIDAYLSPENAAEVAARLLKDSLDRNKGNQSLAVAEYHGGVDRRNWGPRTKSYVKRVVSTAPTAPAATGEESTFSRIMAQRQAAEQAAPSIANIYAAYESGAMDDQAAAEFEADVRAGALMLPRGAKLKEAAQAKGGAGAPVGQSFEETGILPKSVADAYSSGRMAREDRIELEKDVAAGLVRLPAGVALQKTEPMSTWEKIKEPFTGAERKTAEIEASRDWSELPELNPRLFSATPEMYDQIGQIKRAIALAGPQEMAQILKANYPGLQVTQDPKGNFLLKSPIDNQVYGIKPGFQPSDVPRAIMAAAAFAPSGGASTLPGLMATGAGTQALVELGQKKTGGTFDVAEVPTAGLLNVALPATVQGVKALRALRRPRGATVPTPTAGAPIPAAAAGEAATEAVAPGAARAAAPAAAEAGETAATAAARPMPSMAIEPIPGSVPAVAAEVVEEGADITYLFKLARKASGNLPGSDKARKELVELAQINAEAAAAADRIGLDVPIDVFSDNPLVRKSLGLTRSEVGSIADTQWSTAQRNMILKADDILEKEGALFVEGRPSPGLSSKKIMDTVQTTIKNLKEEAKPIYENVKQTIGLPTKVKLNNLDITLKEIVDEVGEKSISKQEKRLLALLKDDKGIKYGGFLREKNGIGEALAGKESYYGKVETGTLKRLYRALATDQLDIAEEFGGEELRKSLRAANFMTEKRKALEKRMVKIFGEEMEGSASSLMSQAINSSSKGGSLQFNKLMKIVPDELKKETLMTALTSMSASRRAGADGAFGFAEFVKNYRGLRTNLPEFFTPLGKETNEVLRDLYEVSKRMVDSNIQYTGKANQILQYAKNAESLVSKVLQSTMAQRGATVAAASVDPFLGGAAAPTIMNIMSKAGTDPVKAMGKVFTSPEFQNLVNSTAKGTPPSKWAIRRLAVSAPFRRYAKEVGIPREISELEKWITTGLQASKTANETPTERKK